MTEKLNEALEELKRVDHLIYVSLKYTRTVDVILNILSRMIDGYSLMTDTLIDFAKDHSKVSGEPESAVERAEMVRRIYGKDQLVTDNMGLYLLLRKLLRARHVVRENEYRRHVTMKTIVEGREEIVNIDIITNYYLFQREFIIHVKGIIDGNVPADLEEHSTGELGDTWMYEQEERKSESEEQVTTVVHRTPPKRSTIKVRPVGSPPRKRAPRPKKYKIQIPKSETSITLPYEYDPHFRKEMEKERARLRAEQEKKALPPPKKAVKPARKRSEKRKKPARKVPRRKATKKKRKPTRKTSTMKKIFRKVVRKVKR